MQPVSTKLGYVPGFDALRGFAVFMVIVYHGSYGLFPGGFLGVDLFFMISGYLITGMLWSEFTASSTLSLKNFYARRMLRLHPALVMGVLLALVLWHYTNIRERANPFIASFASFFYLANIVDEEVMGNMNPFWSLSVEEHFYLLWPLIMLAVLSALNSLQRIRFIALLIAGVTVFRIYAAFHGKWDYGLVVIDPYSFTLCRIDCILIGALVYFASVVPGFDLATGYKKFHQTMLVVSLALLASFGFYIDWSDGLWMKGGFLITNMVSAIVILETLRNPKNPLINNKTIIWIGQRSYGIYVYHYPIFQMMEPLRRHHDPVNFLLVSAVRIILSVVLAALSYKYIEQPALRYKNKFRMRLVST